MFLKITRSGPRRYLQIAEAYRDATTGQPRQRHIVNLGRLDRLAAGGDLDALVDGLLKVSGRPGLATLDAGLSDETTRFEPALSVGPLWVVWSLWRQLNLTPLIDEALQGQGYRVDVERRLRVLVANRLCEPCSKLALLDWLKHQYIPGGDAKITHQQLLRAMDTLLPLKRSLEHHLAKQLPRPQGIEVVFYDITTVRIHGQETLDEDLRQYGASKDVHGTDRQYAVGVVQTADGFPLAHEVFEGNIGESTTLRGIVTDLLTRFAIRRLIVIADRGLLSLDNLDHLEDLTLPDGRAVEYVIAVPARRYHQLCEPVQVRHPYLVATSRAQGQEVIEALPLEAGRRLIVAHDPTRCRQARRQRARRLNPVLKLAAQLERRLSAQDRGQPGRGRRLTEAGAKLKLAHAIKEARASRFLQLDPDQPAFVWWWDLTAFKCDLAFDGKLILLTNVADLTPEALIGRYKELADIERGFRILKSQLEIAPVHHRLPERIRAHTLICFLALVLQRLLRDRLRRRQSHFSPVKVLEQLKAIQYHRVQLANGRWLCNISVLSPAIRDLLQAIEVEVPTRKRVEAAM